MARIAIGALAGSATLALALAAPASAGINIEDGITSYPARFEDPEEDDGPLPDGQPL
ncbi:MAG: hypothetical protein LBE08_13360 [Bifidobacteriaceae bacterium]|jgi:hypothetical protein|nr:hypothetical protein [Bifidobacteriaceae bacterium]